MARLGAPTISFNTRVAITGQRCTSHSLTISVSESGYLNEIDRDETHTKSSILWLK